MKQPSLAVGDIFSTGAADYTVVQVLRNPVRYVLHLRDDRLYLFTPYQGFRRLRDELEQRAAGQAGAEKNRTVSRGEWPGAQPGTQPGKRPNVPLGLLPRAMWRQRVA